jgi:hypothetical protein
MGLLASDEYIDPLGPVVQPLWGRCSTEGRDRGSPQDPAEQCLLRWGGISVPPAMTDDVQFVLRNGNRYGVTSNFGRQVIPGQFAKNVTGDNPAAIAHQALGASEITTTLCKGFTAGWPEINATLPSVLIKTHSGAAALGRL